MKKNRMKTREDKRGRKQFTSGKLAGWLLGIVAVIGATLALNQPPAQAAEVVVYKSPTCGCCSKWVTHMERNGFKVTVHDLRNMSPVKTQLGVPRHLQSCHTAKVGGYVVEGHVPADVIVRMLQERPEIKGIAVPGMPMGSPGMEGPRKDPYDVLAMQKDGRTSVYESR